MKVDAIYSRTRGRKEEAVDSTAPAQDTEQENTQSPEAKKTDNSGKAKSEPAGGVTKSFQSGGRGEFKRGEFKKESFVRAAVLKGCPEEIGQSRCDLRQRF